MNKSKFLSLLKKTASIIFFRNNNQIHRNTVFILGFNNPTSLSPNVYFHLTKATRAKLS